MNVPWMNVVVKKVYINKMKSLVELAALKCPKNNFESTLSRYLTDAQTLVTEFSCNEMFPLSVDGHEQEILDTVTETNMSVKFEKYMTEFYRRKIFMHQYFLWYLF